MATTTSLSKISLVLVVVVEASFWQCDASHFPAPREGNWCAACEHHPSETAWTKFVVMGRLESVIVVVVVADADLVAALVALIPHRTLMNLAFVGY